MQDIYFDHLELRNVRCHEHLTMDFPTGKFNAVVGKNGHGKSTIPKSISMALYGDDGDGNKIADMVNKKTKKNLEILFTFRICENSNEDVYEIRLYQKHHKYHDKMFLFRNGVDISGKTKTETYKKIESIYLPQNIHHNVVYFAQQVKDFFTALTNAEQKEIFNAILNLQEWTERYGTTSKVIEVVQSPVEKQRDRIIEIGATIPERKKLLEAAISEKESRESEIKSRIQEIKTEIDEARSKISVLEKEKSEVGFSEDEYLDCHAQIAKAQSKKDSITSKIDSAAETLEEQIDQKIKEIRSEFSVVLSNNKNEVDTFFNRQKNDENSKLKLVLERMSQVSKKFSCDDLESDRNSFLEEKRKEQRFVDSEISALDKEFSITELQEEKDNAISKLHKKQISFEQSVQKCSADLDSIKKDVTKSKSEIEADKKGLAEEIAVCSKCGRELGKEHKEKIEAEISLNEKNLEKLYQLQAEYESKLQIAQKDSSELIELIKNTELSYGKMVKQKREKKDQKKSELSRKKDLIDKEIQEYNEEIEKKISERKSEEQNALSDLETKKQEIQLELHKIEDTKELKFKELEENNEKDFNESKTEQIEKLTSESEQEKNELLKKAKEVEEQICSIREKQGKLEKLKQAVDKCNLDISSNEQFIQMMGDKLTELEETSFDDSKIEKLKQEISDLEKEKKEISKEIDEILRKIKILDFWKEGFSDRGIKSMLIDSAIPFMNEVARTELEKVSGGKFLVSFDTLSETKSGEIRDKFDVRILNCETGTDKHKLLSGGEKRLVDLCCMKSLRKLAEKQIQKVIHATMFDEALDALDDDNSSIFCRLMKQMSTDQNVMIITHKLLQNMEADQVYKL